MSHTNAIPGHSKRTDLENAPLFPFAYGLSYTSFAYSQLGVSLDAQKEGGPLLINVTVKNTRNRFGEEIVQLYVRDAVAGLTRPVKEL